ncbi:MAG: type VI secretion system protein TssA [Pyrinomonadaceae bacterium]
MSSVIESAAQAAAENVADVDVLLAPIGGDKPAGESLQYTGLYDEIREARRAEDNLAQGDWQRESKVADWNKVETLATGALASRTKDLQVSAWLAESLVKLHGFKGLRDGLRVMRGLHEQFWDQVHPQIEEGDLDGRANALSWMDRQLALVIKEVPITKSSSGVNYTYLDWEVSKQFDIPENFESLDPDAQQRASDARQRAIDEGKVTSEDWRKAKNSTRRAFYEEQYAVLNQCWEEFQLLDRAMDEKFGNQTPGLGEFKKALDDVRTLIEKLVKEKRIQEPDPAELAALEATGEAADTQAEGGAGVASPTGPVRTRQDALRKLADVAEYFQRTEPHSPVSYLVQRAIKWGQMPLELWLEDVIKDGAVLGNLREMLGLNTSDGSSSGEES